MILVVAMSSFSKRDESIVPGLLAISSGIFLSAIMRIIIAQQIKAFEKKPGGFGG